MACIGRIIGVKLLAAISAYLKAQKMVFLVLHNSRCGGHTLVSLFHIPFDSEAPHVNSNIQQGRVLWFESPIQILYKVADLYR